MKHALLLLALPLCACGEGVRLHPEAKRSPNPILTDDGGIEHKTSSVEHGADHDAGPIEGVAPDAGGSDPRDGSDGTTQGGAPSPQTHRLRVSFDGRGRGHVASEGVLSCDSTTTACESDVHANALLSIEARPAAGSVFGGFDGACASAQGNVCSLVMRADADVRARFDAAAPLSLRAEGPGHIETDALDCDGTGANCTASIALGRMLTLTAKPHGDAAFAGWSGDCTGQDETCELTIDGAKTVSVTFMPRYTLNITLIEDTSCAGMGTGFITSSLGGLSCRTEGGKRVETSACSGRFLSGTEVELTAYPQQATTFVGYSGGCTSSERSCTLRVEGDVTVAALFCGLIM